MPLKERLSSLFLKEPSKYKYWLFVAFLIKAAYFLIQIHPYLHKQPYWGEYWGDTHSYFTPIENLLSIGQYTPDYRMPGYGIPYLLLHYFFSSTISYNVFILIQLVLSVVSVYALALLAKNLFNKNFFFYTTFYVYAFSCFTSLFDSRLLTESFSTSALILSAYLLIVYIKNKKHTLILSGLLLTWVFFLRPVYGPLFAVFAVLLAFSNIKNKISLIGPLILFFAPLAIIEGLWVTHNYAQYKRFIPLTKSLCFPEFEYSYLYPVWGFERSWGMDEWRGNWLTRKDTSNIKAATVPFPKYIYTSKFNEDTLKALKLFINRKSLHTFTKYNVGGVAIDSMKENDVAIVREKCELYTQSIKREKPFLYYIRARWSLLKIFLTSSMYTRSEVPVMGSILNLIFYLVLFSGLLGILLAIPLFFKLSPAILISCIPLYSIIIHPFFLHLGSNRYLVPSYPFLVICSVYAMYWLYCKIKKIEFSTTIS